MTIILMTTMKKPTQCHDCQFLDYEEGYCFAYGDGRQKRINYEEEFKVQKWCPLLEVEDAMIDKIKKLNKGGD